MSFQWAAATDPLDEHTLAAVAAGVSTRRYADTLDPVPAGVTERATSSSAVSRRFVALSAGIFARPAGRRRPLSWPNGKALVDGASVESALSRSELAPRTPLTEYRGGCLEAAENEQPEHDRQYTPHVAGERGPLGNEGARGSLVS